MDSGKFFRIKWQRGWLLARILCVIRYMLLYTEGEKGFYKQYQIKVLRIGQKCIQKKIRAGNRQRSMIVGYLGIEDTERCAFLFREEGKWPFLP